MATFCGLHRRKRRYSIAYQSLPTDTKPIVLRSLASKESKTKPATASKRAKAPNPNTPESVADTAAGTAPIRLPWKNDDTSILDNERSEDARKGLLQIKSLPQYHDETIGWEKDNRLSVILEILSERGTPKWEKTEAALNWDRIPTLAPPRRPTTKPSQASLGKRTRWIDHEYPDLRAPESGYFSTMSSSRGRDSPEVIIPRLIEPPPTDLEAISRIDSSLIFEHFTATDAWELGSALRDRLLPIPTPVVVSISLANQNQVLFHTCTHPGVMPDNDNWVARKRKTVLRWGVSTWYMHCKFAGDEVAFREKYGLGNSAGDYAIHGGGIPIRVTGVEGVVAVVVVSGLKQHEDHAVIVEVIRELYY